MLGHNLVASHGKPFILPVAAIALAISLTAGLLWAAPFWLLLLGTVWLFRDPNREIPASPLAVVSPADGRVEDIGAVHLHRPQRKMVRIAIRMSPFGVFTIRGPIEGKLTDVWGVDGSHLSGNRRYRQHHKGHAVMVQTDEHDDVVMVMHVVSRLRRPDYRIHVGERVGQGQRLGHIVFGSTIDLYVPTTARLEVQEGQKVKAGSDILATLIRY